MAPRWLLLPLGLLLSACSWSRFDDVESDPPIVLLKKPSKMSGFGVSLAVATHEGDGTRLLVGGGTGKNPAATYGLGTGTNPTIGAVDPGNCSQGADSAPCYLGDRPAGLGTAEVGDKNPRSLCFVFGIGKADGSNDYGLLGRCSDFTEYTLAVPPEVQKVLIEDEVLTQDAPSPLVMATDKADAPAIVAGAKAKKLAWFYEPLSDAPVQLVPPGTPDEEYGSDVASIRVASGGGDGGAARRLMAVSSPKAGHVWLFSGDDGRPVGCLGGPTGLGRALASGRVDGDDIDDLVVSDDTNVTVFSGAALDGLVPSANIACTLDALPPKAVIASFSCGSRDTVTGCTGGGFGAALAVGDLDGDGDGEVLVGAPQMKVRGTRDAGAVLVYDAEGEHPELLTDQLFLSSAENGDELGSSVAAAPIEGRDVVAAGAPGNSKTALFYCSRLLAGGQGGKRCE